MTRINVVPVETIHGRQLAGEYLELPRVFAHMLQRVETGNLPDKIPPEYVLGTGHVTFFFDKLGYLEKRYAEVCAEMRWRGYDITPKNLRAKFSMIPDKWWGDYTPTADALRINQERIDERLASMKERGLA